MKTCPKCGLVGPVPECFGYRSQSCGLTPQSHCKWCRGKKIGKPDDYNPVVTACLATTRLQYVQQYPNDKAGMQRSWRFMATKLQRKGLPLSEEAQRKLDGKGSIFQ